MSATDAKFSGSIPDIYEQYLVPLLFQPYAHDLAKRVNDLRSGTLIEVAAGTGAVTRALIAALPGVRLFATDLNEAMVRIGAARASGPLVTWQQADAQRLPFEASSAQAVVCQFGVMFIPDKVLAYREAHRVLAPGGRYVFNVWGSLADNPVSKVVSDAVAELFPMDSPRFFERTPFGYHNPTVLRAQLEIAGFSRIEVETVDEVTSGPSAEHVALGLCQGTPLRGEIEARRPAGLDQVTAAAARALEARFGKGPIENRMRALIATAHRD
jgi:ubiquinone/menaquinone biosynthesis C-methylase UbiE